MATENVKMETVEETRDTDCKRKNESETEAGDSKRIKVEEEDKENGNTENGTAPKTDVDESAISPELEAKIIRQLEVRIVKNLLNVILCFNILILLLSTISVTTTCHGTII